MPTSMLTSFLYHRISHLLLTVSIPSLCDQANENVVKETKVKSLMNGVKDSTDCGIEESYVSADKYADIVTLPYVISY